MEIGRTVILLNLENLYESLYDVLNQVRIYMHNYMTIVIVIFSSLLAINNIVVQILRNSDQMTPRENKSANPQRTANDGLGWAMSILVASCW